MPTRRRSPVLEVLEPKTLLMGFSMNPIRMPIMFNLAGTAQGTVVAGQSGETLHASGRITPIGVTQVSGTIRVVGKSEWGALKLDSYGTHLTLYAFGATGQPLRFSINGTTYVPHSTFDFRVVDGGGVVTVGFTPGPKGPMVSLKFGR